MLRGAYGLRIRGLRRQERKLQDVIETIPTFAWTALPDGSVDFVNRPWQEYTGLSTERMVGSGWWEAVHPEDLQRNVEKWRESLATGMPFEANCVIGGQPMGNIVGSCLAQCRYGMRQARSSNGTVPQPTSRSPSAPNTSGKNYVSWRQSLHMWEDRVSILGELAAPSISHELKQPIAAAMTNANACIRWLKREQPVVDEAVEAT